LKQVDSESHQSNTRGFSDLAMSSEISEYRTGRLKGGVQTLILANAAIYYLQVVGLAGSLDGTLGFTVVGLEHHWWTVATYMFVHAGFWHLLANMYALYLFGPWLEQSWGTRRFVGFYAFCALAGLFAHAAFVHDGSALIGSSAPIFGVMVAYAMQWPHEDVFLLGMVPVRVWGGVWILTAINLAVGIYAVGSATEIHFAYFAHLGGALGGWAYMRTPGTPSLEQLRQRVSRIPDDEEPPRPIPRSQPRSRERDETDEIVQRSRAMLMRRPINQTSPRGPVEPRSEELNRVLDKISATGMESLTDVERGVLDAAARKLQADTDRGERS
jgi:membrane associated rhomboid family serine protease